MTNIYRIVAVVGILIGSFGLAALAAYTGPNSSPPSCEDTIGQTGYHPGCNPPIHSGVEAQQKRGPLGIKGDPGTYDFWVSGNAFITGLRSGTVTVDTKFVLPVLAANPASPEVGQMWLIAP